MTQPFHKDDFYRFGPYEVYPRSGELRKHGVRVRLQEQPLQILMLLLARPGDIVLREEIQSELWPENTSVEFDLSINAAIRRLRLALGDSAEEPRYVETVARRGYRFIAAVEPAQRALPMEDPKQVDGPKPEQPAPAIPLAEEPELAGARSGAMRYGWKKAALMIAAVSVIATVTTLVMRSHPRHRLETAIALPDHYTLVGKPALSPDGAKLAAAVMDAERRSQLWVRLLKSGEDRFFPQTAGASSPFWSPDGESIGYFAGNEIKRISSSGGGVTRVYAAVGPAAGAWSPAGTVLYSRGHGMPLFSVAVYGRSRQGPATRLADGETLGHKSPHFLSDGRHFVFLAPNPDERKSAVFLGSLDSFDRKLLLLGASEIEYAAPDYLLFLRNGVVLAQRFNFDRAQPAGPEMSIYDGLGRIVSFSASANGMLSLEFGRPTRQSSLTWHARDGRALGAEGETGRYWQVSMAPDESAAAINMPRGVGGGMLNLLRFGKPGLTPVTANESGHVLDAVWSPDSRSLVYQIYGSDKTRLMMRHLDQPGSKVLLDDGYSNYPDDWSPDGKLLLCRRTGNIAFTLASDGTGKPHILLESSGELDQFRFSPDGKWVAYNSDESGREEVYAARFPEMDHTRQLSEEGGCQPMWRKDGKELFYLDPDGKVFSVNLQTGSAVSAGAPRALFQSSVVVNCIIAQYAVTGNGQKFLMIEPAANGVTESAALQLVRNWDAAGKAN